MSGRILLDTDAVVDFLRGDEAIAEVISGASEVAISTVTLGELIYGAERSQRHAENLAKIERFVSRARVFSCDRATAEAYGTIKNELRRKGRPIPENDIWIAATAKQHDVSLVARDAHFREVQGLSLLSW